MDVVAGHDFAFVRVHPLEHEVQLLEERRVTRIRFYPGDRFARKPASFVSRVKNLGIAPLDFNDQSGIIRDLELVSMIFGLAADEIADVNVFGFHETLRRWTGAAIRLDGVQIDMSVFAARGAIGIAANLERSECHRQGIIGQITTDKGLSDVQ